MAASEVFGEANMVMEGTLKNPNQYRDAILFESLTNLSNDRIKEFVHSEEARVMMKEEMISPEVLDRLVAHTDIPDNDGILKTTICHMAKECDDPLWDELVQARMQERRTFNALIAKYGEEAQAVIESTAMQIAKTIPAYFRN